MMIRVIALLFACCTLAAAQTIPVSSGAVQTAVPNGRDVNAGSTTDAAVSGDANGTISGKLRQLNKMFTLSWDAVNNRFKVNIENTSLPVTGTFWQAIQPVSQSGAWDINNISGTVSLPTGAATEATLAGIKTGTDKIPASPSTDRTTAAAPFSTRLSDGSAFYKATTPSDTQPISAASLPLPTGAATDAKLDTIISNQADRTVKFSQLDSDNDVDATITGTPNVAVTNSPTIKISQSATENDVDVATLPSVTIGTFPDNEPINLAQVGGTAIVNGGLAGSLAVGGPGAHAAASAGNPLLMGAYAEVLGAVLDSTGVAEGDITRLRADPEGRLLVRTEHPFTFTCAMTSTAVTSTVITGCTAPGAGLTRYITDISYASSIISTTANFMTLQYGTGSNCGTGTTVVWRMFNSAAFLPIVQPLQTPIKLGTNTDLCFLHPGAGTRLINIIGYIGIP